MVVFLTALSNDGKRQLTIAKAYNTLIKWSADNLADPFSNGRQFLFKKLFNRLKRLVS